jgi:predicted nucleic acid-binding protein
VIILETNVVSEILRPVPSSRVETWLARQNGANVFLTAVGESELRHGVALLPNGRRRSLLAKAISSILEEDFRNRILPFDSAAARAYAGIAVGRRSAGRPISQFDCQIAAIVACHAAVLATRNTADFEGCGIEMINPWA